MLIGLLCVQTCVVVNENLQSDSTSVTSYFLNDNSLSEAFWYACLIKESF